jgi:nucleotide-binding universal stress UspA family protein
MSTYSESPGGKIVVGVDGSASSQQALRWAARQARLTGAELHAVAVWDYPTGALVLEDVDWFGIMGKTLDEAITTSLDPDDAGRVQRSVLRGYPARVLLDAAVGADLLVVGSRGRGGMVGLLLGSVGQHVVTHAGCPVVVVRAEQAAPA